MTVAAYAALYLVIWFSSVDNAIKGNKNINRAIRIQFFAVVIMLWRCSLETKENGEKN